MVSIKQLALHCKVSPATVSKAINGQKDVSETTRSKVLKAAKELGYFPNSVARALKTNKTYNIGVLFNDDTLRGLTHEYFSHVLEAFKVEVEMRGYDVTFINRNIGGRERTYLEHCMYRGVDGVCIACVDFNTSGVVELANSDIPVVTIDYQFNDCSSVISDNITGIHELTEYICSCGHKRIAFIHGEKTAVTENRLKSFYRTMEKYGNEICEGFVRQGRYHDPNITAKITKELLELPNRPTCIIFPDDFSAIGGINVIRDSCLTIPEDISVAGYDGIYLATVLSPKLTTYRQNTEMLGRKAATQLINHIEKSNTTLVERIMVKGELLRGNSVKVITDIE